MLQTSILVVEDDKNARESLEAFLSDLGHRVETACDADSAIAKIRTLSFDIIVTDKNMPDSKGADSEAGLHVLRFAAENSPETQVIIATGYASLENAIESMKKGAFDYLTKPFTLDRLESVIARVNTYRSFINSQQAISSYRNLHREVLDILEKTSLKEKDRLRLLRMIEDRIDDFFKTQKRFENIIIDQRDSLANIAMFAAMLGEKLADAADPEITELLAKITRIADRRL